MHHTLGEAWLEAQSSSGWPPKTTHHVVSEASLQHTERGSFATVYVVPGTEYTLRWCLAPPKSAASAHPHLSLASLKLNGVEAGQRLLGNRASHLDSKLANILHRALLAGPALPSRVFSSDELASEPLALASEERQPGFEARYSLVLRIWRQPAVVARAIESGKHALLHDIVAGAAPTVCFDFVCLLEASRHATIPLPIRASTPEIFSKRARRTSTRDKEEVRRSQLPHAATNFPQLIGRTGHHKLTSSRSASPLVETRTRSPSPSSKLWSRFSVSSSDGRRSHDTTPTSESLSGRGAQSDFCWPVRRPEPSLYSGSASSRTETGSRSSRRRKGRSPRTSNASSGATPSTVSSGPPALAALYTPATTPAYMPPEGHDILAFEDATRLSRVVEAKPARSSGSPGSARSSWLGGTLEGISNLGRRRSATPSQELDKQPSARATPEPVSIAQAPSRTSRRTPAPSPDGRRSPWQRLRTAACHAATEAGIQGAPALPRSRSSGVPAQTRDANQRSGSLPTIPVRPVVARPDSLGHYAPGSPGLRVSSSAVPSRPSSAARPRTPETSQFVTDLDDIYAEQPSVRRPGSWQPNLGALTEASFDLPARTFVPEDSETEMDSVQWYVAPDNATEEGAQHSSNSSDSTWRSTHSRLDEVLLDEPLTSTEGPLSTVEAYDSQPSSYAKPHLYDVDPPSPTAETLSGLDELTSPISERTSFFPERTSYAETFGHGCDAEQVSLSCAETFGPGRVAEEDDDESLAGSSDSFLTAATASQDTWTAARAELQTSVSHIQSMESEINDLLVQEALLRRELAERAALTQACLESHRESVKFLSSRLEASQPASRRESRPATPASPRPTSARPASRSGGSGVRPLMLLQTDGLPSATPLSAPPTAGIFARRGSSPSDRSSPIAAQRSLSPTSAGRPDRWNRREGLPYARITPHAGDRDSLDGLDVV